MYDCCFGFILFRFFYVRGGDSFFIKVFKDLKCFLFNLKIFWELILFIIKMIVFLG